MENTLELNYTGNHKKLREPPKMLILSKEHFEPNNTGNHKRWRDLPKLLILSGKHIGAKLHYEPLKIKGTTQNVNFEQEALWSPKTLGIQP